MAAPPRVSKTAKAKAAAIKEWLRPVGNVVGVGIGNKDGKDYLRIYVVNDQLPLNISSPQKLLRADYNGVPAEVIKIGRLGKRGKQPKLRTEITPQPGSPIRVQTDAPNVNSGAVGTLGAVVVATDSAGAEHGRYILSCNHILAANGRVNENPTSRIVWAQYVGEQQVIADPDVYVPLSRNGANPADCALARIKDHINFSPIFPEGIGPLNSPDSTPPKRDQLVKTVGAATGLTSGTIVDVDADLYVDDGFGTFLYANQVIIDAGDVNSVFAAAGDSGSVVLNDKNQAVAMVFAGSGRFAAACPLTRVVDLLEKELQQQNGTRRQRRNGSLTLHLVTKPGTK